MNYLITLFEVLRLLLPAWLLDRIFGDPQVLPHPVTYFGKAISFFEKRLNRKKHKRLKGAFTAIFLILAVWGLAYGMEKGLSMLSPYAAVLFDIIMIFFCLAGKTLETEVKKVFEALEKSLAKGREQVARIVGRDTSELSAQEVRTAALETLSENLSDGVVAPLFWFILLGVPGMLAYKMVNTLDSMIGYRNEKYLHFGCCAAKIDDIANFIPARITAVLMLLVKNKLSLMPFVLRYGREHASPNSGYPESALAAILDCRFGGPHDYFRETVYKPYIGNNNRRLTSKDMKTGITINRRTEAVMMLIVLLARPAMILLYNSTVITLP